MLVFGSSSGRADSFSPSTSAAKSLRKNVSSETAPAAQEGKANTAVYLTAGEGTPAVGHIIGVENDYKASGT